MARRDQTEVSLKKRDDCLQRYPLHTIVKISVTSPIVIDMPIRELLAGDTKNSFV